MTTAAIMQFMVLSVISLSVKAWIRTNVVHDGRLLLAWIPQHHQQQRQQWQQSRLWWRMNTGSYYHDGFYGGDGRGSRLLLLSDGRMMIQQPQPPLSSSLPPPPRPRAVRLPRVDAHSFRFKTALPISLNWFSGGGGDHQNNNSNQNKSDDHHHHHSDPPLVNGNVVTAFMTNQQQSNNPTAITTAITGATSVAAAGTGTGLVGVAGIIETMDRFKKAQRVGKITAALLHDLTSTTVEGTADNGKVRVIMDGQQQPIKVELIDDTYWETTDTSDVAAAMTAAMKDAHMKSIERMESKTKNYFNELGFTPKS